MDLKIKKICVNYLSAKNNIVYKWELTNTHVLIVFSLGISKRRRQVTDLIKKEETFQRDLDNIIQEITDIEELASQDIHGVSLEKCQKLNAKYQVLLYARHVFLYNIL